MEIGGSAGEYAKRIVELEFQCMKLNLENINLKEQVMEVKGKDEKMMKKYVKVKDKFVKVMEKWNSDKMKWREEEEKIREECRQMEAVKKKLEIDIKEAITNGSVEVAESSLMANVEHFQSFSEESDHTITTLEKVNGAEKRVMEDDGKKMVSELIHRIEVLERENREMEIKFCPGKTEKSDEIKRISNEKMADEAEEMALAAESKKKELELVQRIEVLEREKKKLEKDMLDVVSRSGVLEREKRELEAETREKDERFKLLLQEKECLTHKNKIMEIKTNWRVVKSEVDLDLSQQVHPARNGAILSSLTVQNRGPKSVDVSVTEPEESSDGSIQLRGMIGSKIPKRAIEGLGCPVANQAGTKRCKLDDLAERKLVWKNRQDMLSSFTDNDELCMRSVCALYRKYKSLGDSKNHLRSAGYIGFMPPYETRGMALGELLTSGDPEGKLKKSLAEFEQTDPCGLLDCRLIAIHHDKELFGIYSNNLDPLFISVDDNLDYK